MLGKRPKKAPPHATIPGVRRDTGGNGAAPRGVPRGEFSRWRAIQRRENGGRRLIVFTHLLTRARDVLLGPKAHLRNGIMACVIIWIALGLPSVWAGPPFVTDDPGPVEYRHGEFYIASQYAHDGDGVSMTAPQFECNLGALPEMQFHLIVPLATMTREAVRRNMVWAIQSLA